MQAFNFCYYVYNIQPGIGIDYQTGDSWEDASVVAKDNTTYRVTGTANVQAQEEQTEATETVTPQPAQQEVESAPPATIRAGFGSHRLDIRNRFQIPQQK